MPRDTKKIEKKITQILADKLDIDEKKIKPESKLMDDLGMDSFAAVEVMFGLKEEFKIDIPEGDLKDVRLVKDIAEYIQSHS